MTKPTIIIPATTGGAKRYAVEDTTPALTYSITAPADQSWALTAWRRVQQRGYAVQLVGEGPTARSGDHGVYSGSGPITAAALIAAWPDTSVPPAELMERCRTYDQRFGDWTPSEDNIIRKLYAAGGADVCMAKLPGRTRNSIQHRAGELGETRQKTSSSHRWTPAEDAIIADQYPKDGGTALVERLPGRSAKSIRLRASRLGVTNRKRQPAVEWTAVEDKMIRDLYPTEGSAPIAEQLAGRSAKAIQSRARELGIRYITR